MSVGRLYTGSAADYEKPSLLKVGTGEGSQVYGWGLYASNKRDVAEHYADRDAWTGKALKTKSGLVVIRSNPRPFYNMIPMLIKRSAQIIA